MRRPSVLPALLLIFIVGWSAAAPAAAQSDPFPGLEYETTLEYSCAYPLVTTPQPLTVDVSSAIEAPAPSGPPIPPARIATESTVVGVGGLLKLLGVASVAGQVELGLTVDIPGIGAYPLAVTQTVELAGAPDSPTGDLTLVGEGEIPALRYPQVGVATYRARSLSVTLTPRDASGNVVRDPAFSGSDGDSSTLEGDCTSVRGDAGDVIKTVDVVPDDSGLLTPRPTPAPTPTPVPTPTPAPRPTTLSVSGAAQLGTLTRGNVGISGELTYTAADRTTLRGTTSLDDASATLQALGFLPIRATIGFTPEALDGTDVNTVGVLDGFPGPVSLRTAQTILLRRASVFGVELVYGDRCRTERPSVIQLSADGVAQPLERAALAGSFSIGNLTDCGFLTFLLSPLTAGDGNVMQVVLASGIGPN